MGPSCMEASLSASPGCHRNLISHGRLWVPSMRIYVVFTQRESNVVIKKKKQKTHKSNTHGQKKNDNASFGNSKAAFRARRCRARVSFCMNNSFYLIMHFQKLALLIKTVSGCSQVRRQRPCSAVFHGMLYLKSSVLKCFKFTLGKQAYIKVMIQYF